MSASDGKAMMAMECFMLGQKVVGLVEEGKRLLIELVVGTRDGRGKLKSMGFRMVEKLLEE